MTSVAEGMPDNPDGNVLLCVRMKQHEIKALDRIAKSRTPPQNRSELVRDLLLAGIRIFNAADAPAHPQETLPHDQTGTDHQHV